MNRTLTCIICPNGCELDVTWECQKNCGSEISENLTGAEMNKPCSITVSGNKCPRGVEYAEQEIKNPMRTIASSVKLEGGTMSLVSVRVNGPIPKAKIKDVMDMIQKTTVTAPVKIGDVVIPNVLDLGVDVIATRNIMKK